MNVCSVRTGTFPSTRSIRLAQQADPRVVHPPKSSGSTSGMASSMGTQRLMQFVVQARMLDAASGRTDLQVQTLHRIDQLLHQVDGVPPASVTLTV